MKFLKNLLRFIKWITVGALWSYLYLYGTLLLFKSVWGFNYLSRSNWRVISDFWEQGGKIRTGSDYLFILCLILLIPIWIWGWKKLYKANLFALIIAPILWYQKRKADKYIKGMSRIKIHNIGISVGEEIKQDFENKLKQQKEEIEKSPKAVAGIRSDLSNKLREKK